MTGRFEGSGGLPAWGSVLVVVAHPDDESFGLGAVIDRFVESGASVGVLCFTHGEASTLHGVAGDLRTLRASELAAAARVLGISSVRLLDYPDGGLSGIPRDELADHVTAMATELRAEGFLVFDSSGVTGHPDHVQATSVATLVGERLGLGVLAWTLPNPLPSQLAEEFGAGFSRGRPRTSRAPRPSARGGYLPPEPGRSRQRLVASARAPRRPGTPALVANARRRPRVGRRFRSCHNIPLGVCSDHSIDDQEDLRCADR